MTVPLFDPALGQWWTPYGLALSMLRTTFGELLEGATVLEPSAGVGAFVAAALECGARHVVAVEIDPRLVAHLRGRFADDPRVEVVQADFLRFASVLRRRRFDFVIGNPPYDHGADVDHLEAWNAIEASAGRLALTKTNTLAGGDAWRRVWCRSTITDVGICVRRPAFSGTTNGPRQIEFAALAWRDATADEIAKRGTVPKNAPRSSSEALARLLAVMPGVRVSFYG
jgi:predicted RNA methylase